MTKDRWEVIGTSIDKKTGKPSKYIVVKEPDGTWKCSCMAWIMQKKKFWVNGKRTDCQHILRKKLELQVPAEKVKVTSSTTYEEGKVTRSITFEDIG